MQDIFEGAGLQERTTNYIQLAKNLANEYGYSHSLLSNRLSHGVQKDAIQNGWDAKLKKTHKFVENSWKFELELTNLKNGEQVLVMTDFGTCGLTGNLTSDDLKSAAVSADDLPEKERWARWESFGYTKEKGLGARGQGKMIFMLASKIYTIYYDSLRSDGSYRFGGSIATETGCPIGHYDEEKAKQVMNSKLGLKPLSHQGTRVIIMNPVDEIIEDIHNGNFLRFIEETWWPNILKFGAKIMVKYDGKVTKVKVPAVFPITKVTPEDKSFKTWVRDESDFKKKRAQFKIKHLCVACNMEDEADELYQGVACFRDGMKVDVIRFPDRPFRNKVFGYIEFDEELEEELRAIENSTHYAFKGTLWAKLKNLIEQELEAFGNKKLGLAIDRQALANIRRTSAESKALSILRAVTKNWPISKWSKGGGGGGDGGDSPYKTMGVRLSNLSFPNPGNIPRLDYGQKLEGFDIVVFNREEKARDVTLDAFVLSGGRRILDIRKQSFQLKSKSREVFSNHSVGIGKKDFEAPGEYRLRLNLVDNSINKRIDQITRRFWVEMDPKLAGPFDVRPLNFTELPDTVKVNKRREWYLQPEGDGRYTFYYNWGHPAYTHNDETEAKLTTYLSELFLLGALELLIRQGLTKKEELKDVKEVPLDLELIKSSETLEVYGEYTLALSKIRESIYGLV